MIDLHAHVLPRLDDGARHVAEAVAMCSMAREDGITTLVATPHMLCDAGNPTKDRILSACRELRDILRARGVELDVACGAEVRMVEDLHDRVASGEVPTLDSLGRYVLVEPLMVGDHGGFLREVVFRLQLHGVTPVIAHPERAEMFHADRSLAHCVVEQGALLQVTASSVVEALPARAPGLALDMLRSGLVHVLASDAHDARGRPPILSEAREVCGELLGAEQAELLVTTNPARILAGADVTPATPGGSSVPPRE